MSEAERLVQLGVVAKAHGLRGEVAIWADEGVVEDILKHDTLLLRPPGGEARPRRVSSARAVPRGVLVSFEGVGDRIGAEALRGYEVLLPRSSLTEKEGEYLTGELIGLEALTPEGQRLGRVEAIFEGGGEVPNLVIGKRELHVPLADVFVKRVDLEAGQIVIEPPEEE
ncbi:MAG: ribosome maturation factor RimM [Myxococcales bacterium]|jgi:16S rRNA processing protein RimM